MATKQGNCTITELYINELDDPYADGWILFGPYKKRVGFVPFQTVETWWKGKFKIEYSCAAPVNSTDLCKPCVEIWLEYMTEENGVFTWHQLVPDPDSWNMSGQSGGIYPMGDTCGATHQFTFNFDFRVDNQNGNDYRVRMKIGNPNDTGGCDVLLTTNSPPFNWDLVP